jgi:hypothetical protein
MKIRKLITEAKEGVEAANAVIKPQDDSVAEIADAVQDSVEDATGGEVTLSDTNAQKVAAEIKDTAEDAGAGEAIVLPAEKDDVQEISKNRLTDVLDDALFEARRARRQHTKTNSNVLVCGLPGSGKTAIVYDWARANGCNIFYLDAKDPNLETVINGMPLRDVSQPNLNKVVKAGSTVLKPLHRPNSILFLDELNRQIKPHIRASLLTLVNEKAISGDDESGRESFQDTLLFTIAAINPAVPTDKGAVELNDAEKSRFINKIMDFDSDPEAAIDYFTKHFNWRIAQHKNHKNSWIEAYVKEENVSKEDAEKAWLEEAEYLVKTKDLIIYIITHPIFAFDSRDDLEDLSDGSYTMLNQRLLTDAAENSLGDKNRFLR